MTLRLVQSLYHSGKYSTRAKGLMEIEGEGLLHVNAREARRLGIEEGQPVRLANDGGQATVSVKLNDRVPDAVAWFPEHFDQSVRALFSLNSRSADPRARVEDDGGQHRQGPVTACSGRRDILFLPFVRGG